MRKITMYWKPLNETLKAAERLVEIGKFLNGNPKFETEHQCAKCKQWFPKVRNKKGALKPGVAVDHIVAIGGWSDNFDNWHTDLGDMYKRALVTSEGLWCLCPECHSHKSAEERESGAWKR